MNNPRKHPKHGRGKAVVALGELQLTVEQWLVILSLDVLSKARVIDQGYLAAVWRRFAAGNLTPGEFKRRAFKRNVAETVVFKRWCEIRDKGFGWVADGMPRLTAKGADAAGLAREAFAPALPVPAFVEFSQQVYKSLGKRVA